jgi:DNA-binding CsgD family transcriptional regulator
MIKSNIKKVIELNNRWASIILISILGAWIMCFPYEGQLLYTIARNYGMESNRMLDISLILLVVGLILGGIFIKNFVIAKKIIVFSIPICIICTISFILPLYTTWMITLNICSITAGICIAALGYIIKDSITPENRFRTLAVIIIIINILRLIINSLLSFISIETGITFTVIMLGAVWYLMIRIQFKKDIANDGRVFDKKAGFKALFILFVFIIIIGINYGIMIETVDQKYKSFSWLTSWYWLLPYAGSLLIMRNLKNTEERSNILYISVGMIGSGFILFFILDNSIGSYLAVNTILMGAWAVYDLFRWSILAEMIEMVKNSAKILSIGFSAFMIGVLAGKIIGESTLKIAGQSLYIASMTVIFLTLLILPILHKLLSKMIKKNEKPINKINTKIIDAFSGISAETFKDDVFPDNVDTLTEREKQITALMLKGRTCKLIAEELYLSENTVKTHIKNIYSKMGVKRKSDLFDSIIK